MLEKKLIEELEDIHHSIKMIAIIGGLIFTLLIVMTFTIGGWDGLGYFAFALFVVAPSTIVITMILVGVYAQKKKQLNGLKKPSKKGKSKK